jgi:hypothetical protein
VKAEISMPMVTIAKILANAQAAGNRFSRWLQALKSVSNVLAVTASE